MTDFTKIAIEELIPQRFPIVMIDSVLSYSDDGLVSCFRIDEKNVFVENGRFCEAGLIENMAQTAAANNGLSCRIENRIVPVGFIGAINNLIIHFLPETGNVIQTKVTETANIMNASVIKAEIICNDMIAAECEMKIFLME